MGLAYPRAIGVLSGRSPEPGDRTAARERRIVLLGRSAPGALRELIVRIPGFAALPAPNRFPAGNREAGAVAVVYGPAAGAEITELRAQAGQCPPILAISPSPDVAVAIEVLRRGATSYLVDGEYTRADLAAALRTTARGESTVSPVITTALVRRFHGQRSTVEGGGPELLTPRERDLLRLLAEGHSNTQIADRLCLAEKTVRNYISRLYTKLGVASRAEAIVWWLRRSAP